VAGPGDYQADPNLPANQNGKVVFWLDQDHYRVQSIDAYLSTPNPHNAVQALHSSAYNETRQTLGQIRRTLLAEIGNVSEDHIVEIPVLLSRPEQNKFGTDTADSVNMLLLRTGDNTARCLIPKPFGPVCANTYIFQYYMERKLGNNGLGLNVGFVNDWEWYHRFHGEVHCGTNQIPRPLPVTRAWWRRQPA
jgi:hypothetical protein